MTTEKKIEEKTILELLNLAIADEKLLAGDTTKSYRKSSFGYGFGTSASSSVLYCPKDMSFYNLFQRTKYYDNDEYVRMKGEFVSIEINFEDQPPISMGYQSQIVSDVTEEITEMVKPGFFKKRIPLVIIKKTVTYKMVYQVRHGVLNTFIEEGEAFKIYDTLSENMKKIQKKKDLDTALYRVHVLNKRKKN